MAEDGDAIWRKRVESLFRHSPALLAVLTGPDHVYQLVSERFLDLIGHRDIIGKAAREALPGLAGQGFGGEEYFALLDRIYATGQTFSGQELPARVRRPDGAVEEHFFTVVIQPTHDSQGKVDGLLIQGTDITAQVRARQQVEHALTREQAAHAVTAALAEALTPMEVIRVVVEHGASVFQASAASVALQTEGDRAIEIVYSQGYEPDVLHRYQRFPLDTDVPLAAAIRQGAPIWIESSEAWTERFPTVPPAHRNRGSHAAAALPLLIEGRVIGGIGLSFSQARVFGEEDRAFMSALAQQCAQALDRTRLYEAAHRQAALLDLAHDAVLIRDMPTHRVAYWNKGAERLYGWTQEEALGQVAHELLRTRFPEPLPQIEARVQEVGHWEGELHQTTRGNRHIVVSSRWALEQTEDGRSPAILSINTDITEQKEAQAALAHLALHDALTGLPNRYLFQDRLQQAVQLVQRGGEPLALLLMDLVRFKEVNDSFGHHIGDALLRGVGERLQHTLRQSDTAARLGGDEFAAILPATDATGAEQVAKKIAAALWMPFELQGEWVETGAAIGIALCPQHGMDETLLRHADVAMYGAKRAGRAYALYDPTQDAAHRSRHVLINELRHAIDHDQLVLHYQPVINLETGHPERLEALVRWHHPEHGLLLPDCFIGLAEETGLMEPLTHWVLLTALTACQRWQLRAPSPCVAVNLSAASLRDPALGESIAAMVHQSGVAAANLTLELTESAVMAEPEHAMQILTPLHEMGVTIAIDDFGTGHSSLAYLKRLPVDGIKIDRSFVRDLARNEHDYAIVRSVINLGHDLNQVVTAEGVEDGESYRLLAQLGCDCAQGYYIASPLPAPRLDEWLRQY